MSIKLMAQVWEYQLTRGEQAVLLAMADHADDNGNNCFPSIALLAWKTDYSERQITRILQQLTQRKVLEIVVPATNRRPTEYAIRLQHATPKQAPPVRSAWGDTTSPLEVTPRHPKKPARGDISNARGDILHARGDIAMSPEPLEPSLEPSVSERVRAREPAPPAPSAKPKAVIVYHNLVGFPPDVVGEQAIIAAVGEDEPSLKRWGDAVTAWLLSGHRGSNVRGMLDWYRDGVPSYKLQETNGNGQPGRSAGHRARPPAPVVERVYDPALEDEFN